MIAILDYKAGNQTSVKRALDYLGIPCVVTADRKALEKADGVIFPGVGAAGQAMGHLKENGLDDVLRHLVAVQKPLLGICLGCQILIASSEEDGGTPTLGIMPGTCRRFASDMVEEDGSAAPVPHMGWNSLAMRRPSALFTDIPADAQFYFVHSYYVDTDPSLVFAACRYGIDFCAAYGRDGLWAVQFHPEKSGEPGLRLLRNFNAWCMEASSC